LECKSILLAKRCPQGVHSAVVQNSKLKENSGCVQVPEIIHHDECILVKEKDAKLPEWERDDLIEKWPQTQVDALLDRLQISIKGEDPPRPILEFADCKFVPKIQENLEKEGYDLPTPVQMQAIPAALEGRDIMVSAETGSGKTAAFLFPIIMRCCMIRIWGLSEQQRPLAMVLAPTRELSAQVEEQAKAIAKGLPFKTALVVGGDAMPRQLYRIKQGVELIIGTPGRLIDLLSKHNVILQVCICWSILAGIDSLMERVDTFWWHCIESFGSD
jgi:ATP-dependent RNA helicase DDX59